MSVALVQTDISLHAIQRYQERIEQISSTQARRAIHLMLSRSYWMSDCVFDPITMTYFGYRNGVITTVIGPQCDLTEHQFEITAAKSGYRMKVDGIELGIRFVLLGDPIRYLTRELRATGHSKCRYGCLVLRVNMMGKISTLNSSPVTSNSKTIESAAAQFEHQCAVHKRWTME